MSFRYLGIHSMIFGYANFILVYNFLFWCTTFYFGIQLLFWYICKFYFGMQLLFGYASMQVLYFGMQLLFGYTTFILVCNFYLGMQLLFWYTTFILVCNFYLGIQNTEYYQFNEIYLAIDIITVTWVFASHP